MSGFVLRLQELVLSSLGHDYQSWPGGWLGLESRCVSPLHYPPKMTYTKSPWLDKTLHLLLNTLVMLASQYPGKCLILQKIAITDRDLVSVSLIASP